MYLRPCVRGPEAGGARVYGGDAMIVIPVPGSYREGSR
jgi:hypothetical protein